jgi:CHASE3 domain sensor protein
LNLLAFNRVLRTTLLMPVVLLGLLAGVLVWQIQEAVDAQTRVAIADELIQRLYQLQSSIVDEETGLRGYQLTGACWSPSGVNKSRWKTSSRN